MYIYIVLSRTYNGDCPNLSGKLISTPELSKHLTTSICPWLDALINGDPFQ